MLGEQAVKALAKCVCGLIQVLYEAAIIRLQYIQGFQGSRHGQRMVTEGASHKSGTDLRYTVIIVIPVTAVGGIQKTGFPCYDTDRQTTANDLLVGCNIRPYSEQCLATAQVCPEACNHFVEDQRDIVCFGYPAQLLQVFNRL